MTSMTIERWRDLTLLTLNPEQVLVIACDSAGAVGPKPLDALRVPGEIIGQFTARVPLMEVLSIGAEPIAVIDTLSVEPQPTGAAIRRGIEQELRCAGLDPGLALNGSEEKNFPTQQTGLGVTVIGIADRRWLRRHRTQSGDRLCVIGYPYVGSDLLTYEAAVADIGTIRTLTALPGVHDILPVGSRGIRAEAHELLSAWSIRWSPAISLPMEQSAGPATCVLVSIAPAALSSLSSLGKPVTVIAEIEELKCCQEKEK